MQVVWGVNNSHALDDLNIHTLERQADIDHCLLPSENASLAGIPTTGFKTFTDPEIVCDTEIILIHIALSDQWFKSI